MKATIKPLNQRAVWKSLAAHRKQIKALPLRDLFQAKAKGIFGTKMRSAINQATAAGIEGIVNQRSDAEYNALLDGAIQSLFEASTVKPNERTPTCVQGDIVKAAA